PDSVQTPIAILHSSLTIRSTNPAFRALTDCPPDVENRSFPDLAVSWWDMRQITAQLERIREEGEGACFQFEHETRGGKRILLVHGLSLRADGEPILFLTIHDITVV